MGKYAESVGIWEHKLGDITHNITPEEQDNLEFVKIKRQAEKTKNESVLIEGISELYYNMVLRSDGSLTDDDKGELKTWISVNINQITEDLMIAYKWTTPEQLDKLKDKAVEVQKKNEM